MSTKSKAGMGTWVVATILVALLVGVIIVYAYAFPADRMPRISVHGWIAMGVGAFFSLLIGCGLMWLSFYSSRAGFDDRADPGRLSKDQSSPRE
jgi:protein-S-isoprenylcysteine O-methyltransferase Ste14